MSTIQILKENAVAAYNQASDETKGVLATLFGNDVVNQKITDRVKTLKDAIAVLGGVSLEVMQILNYTGTDKDMLANQVFTKVSVITRALNEGWVPDWEDSNQAKWAVYLTGYKAGFGFSDASCDGWSTDSIVGSRLCFKSRELAEYAGKQFFTEYNALHTL